jgi:hypothetical protein
MDHKSSSKQQRSSSSASTLGPKIYSTTEGTTQRDLIDCAKLSTCTVRATTLPLLSTYCKFGSIILFSNPTTQQQRNHTYILTVKKKEESHTITMTTHRIHLDHENPWESAANDRLWEQAQQLHTPSAESTTALLNGDSNHYGSSSSTRGISSLVFQVCHVGDMVVGISLALYTGLVELPNDRIPSIFVLALSLIVVLRGILAKITKCGVTVSATVSFALSLLCLILALCLWGLSLSEATHTCLVFPLHWCQVVSPLQSAGVLLIVGIIEGIRYIWIRTWMHEEATTIRDVLNQSEITEQRRRQSPWWWGSRDGHHERLLPLSSAGPHWSSGDGNGYHMDHGVGTPERTNTSSSSWWPFRRRRDSDVNLRDDASVEYASLNEDWASRSQEDPFWWTREEGARSS